MTAKLIVGNWKMNGLQADSRSRAADLATRVSATPLPRAQMVLAPPFTALMAAAASAGHIAIAGQDCHDHPSGAFTGDVSAAMLKDLGCAFVILGHSERRHGKGETSAQVSAKATAAAQAGLTPIICVGETDAERSAGRAEDVVGQQLAQSIPPALLSACVVAYEPVWAIGTGKTASAKDIRAMHHFIRGRVGLGVRLLYGGSVKASNAVEILSTPDVDGVLVGGASLNVEEFWQIASSA